MSNWLVQQLTRKKVFTNESVESSGLKRCLTTIDIVGLGIGSTLGAGLYVVAGQVAHETAGPAVILSFFVAGVASAFAAMCYAEFAARIPRAGSAYVYSYVIVGEFMAFIIGWNLVLEYVIGTASVARGWSSYFDSLIDKKMSKYFEDNTPMYISQLSSYPDFLAFALSFLLSIVLAAGVKESTRVNNVFTCVNLFVVAYVFICGMFKIDWANWNIPEDEVPKGYGVGGFFPHGFSGVMAGAATCFYCFVGFDCVATTGEETKNPQRAIPIGIIISLIVIFLCYLLVSGVITLMCPYYLIDHDAPLPFIFQRVGWGVARYIIAVGALCALSTSLLGAMFPLPRILYAMGSDGLIFRFMGTIHPRWKTPVVGTLISGVFAGGMAMIFDINELVNMMSIGTLLAYSMVAVSVLILRYEPDCNLPDYLQGEATDHNLDVPDDTFHWRMLVSRSSSVPTVITSRITKGAMAMLFVFVIAFSAFLVFAKDYLTDMEGWAIAMVTILFLCLCLSTAVIWVQPPSPNKLAFKVPLVPLTPVLSIVVNIYLMMSLPSATWVRFGIWMAIGILIYFCYGMWHDRHETKDVQEEKTATSSPRSSTPLLTSRKDRKSSGEDNKWKKPHGKSKETGIDETSLFSDSSQKR